MLETVSFQLQKSCSKVYSNQIREKKCDQEIRTWINLKSWEFCSGSRVHRIYEPTFRLQRSADEKVQTSLTTQMLFNCLSIQKNNMPLLSSFSSFFAASKWQEGLFLLSSPFPSFFPVLVMLSLESGSPKEPCCRLICSDIIWDFAVSCGFWASWQRAPSVWCHPSAYKIFCTASLPAARQKTNPSPTHTLTHTRTRTRKFLCFSLREEFHR